MYNHKQSMTKEDKQLLQESRILSEILSRNIKKLKCQIFFEIVTVVQRCTTVTCHKSPCQWGSRALLMRPAAVGKKLLVWHEV